MASREILIKNACVITGRGPVFPHGYVHIVGGSVASVGPQSKVPRRPKATQMDAQGRYVLPGFMNPHMHLYSALARGKGVGRMKSFGRVLKDFWWRLDQALSPEDMYISAMLGGVEAIRSGVTILFDHHASYGAISGSLGAISMALAKVGIRASLCFEISDRAGKRARDEALAESGLWLESVHNWLRMDPDFLQRGMVGLHASMTLSDATLDAAREMMDIYGVGAHVHVAEGQEDVSITRRRHGLSPVARLTKRKILRPGTLAVHCVHVDKKDITLLAKSGACVVHNPLSNLNNAVGIAPILEMCRRKIPVVVGTDGMSAGVVDDIRLASVLHKPSAGDPQAGWNEVARAVWVTAPVVASQMFGTNVGILKKGAAADVIVVDARPPTPVTSANAWGHVLFGILNAPVRTAIVGGQVRMRDFRMVGIDEQALAREAGRLSKRLWKRF